LWLVDEPYLTIIYYGTGTPLQSAVTKCHIMPAMPDVNDASKVDLMRPHEFDAIDHPTNFLTLRCGVQKKGDEW
jgi:hypothetical protein